ncbi:hypothetical protein [Streptomyces sp. NPDC012888]|uniref:hypothetical protein n=1 Tax=Streptomyces sp. NPDC012888 TaxID=3364855 RepID=UPI00369047F2
MRTHHTAVMTLTGAVLLALTGCGSGGGRTIEPTPPPGGYVTAPAGGHVLGGSPSPTPCPTPTPTATATPTASATPCGSTRTPRATSKSSSRPGGTKGATTPARKATKRP